MFALVPYRQLGAPRFGGTGVVSHVVRGRGLLAIASDFDLLFWEARAIYDGHWLRHRIALYDERDGRRVAAFDHARFPIRDLAFHPSAPELAIGTGSYDGGYAFEGELLIWNWETGAWRSVLSGSREIVRVEYRDRGQRLALLLRPRTDEEFELEEAYVGTVLEDLSSRDGDGDDPRLEGLQPIDPASIGLPPRNRHAEDEWRRLRLEIGRLGLVEGEAIWDLAWLDDGRLAAAYDDGRVELWRPAADAPQVLRVEGRAVQLLRHPDVLLVNAIESIPGERARRSTLYAVRGEELTAWQAFRTARACSIDAGGRILARDTRPDRAPGTDLVIDRGGAIALQADLGHYDCFNHHVRLDGAGALYFLRGTPPGQHLHKVLCSIGGTLAAQPEMPWDGPGEAPHLMSGSAILVGGDVVRACSVYDSRGTDTVLLERCRLGAGQVVWRHVVEAGAVALAEWPAARCVVFALTDGTLCALDAATGDVLHHEPFLIDDQPTIVTALAVHDDAIALGTIDGRLSILARR